MPGLVPRVERRIQRNVCVELSSLDGSMPGEIAFTENVSSRGARVETKRPWRPGDRVLVKSLEGGLRSVARVVYCGPSQGKNAVGLELLDPTGDWLIHRS